jgi:hypothetical protein
VISSSAWRHKVAGWRNNQRIAALTSQVKAHSPSTPGLRPVVFFNASARLGGLSQNAAFAFLTGAGLRLSGIPVYHFVCWRGMSHCVLGTNREDHHKPPPCQSCIRQSRRLYQGANVQWFEHHPDPILFTKLKTLNMDELVNFELRFELEGSETGELVSLGKLALPSLRWALRRHTLSDDEETRYLLREYILSAANLMQEFAGFLAGLRPKLVFIFNGIMYPEASARWVARQMGFRVVTHEVGFQRFSAFFTDGEATAYPILIPPDFELSDQDNRRLDEYLENRFQGKFSMAGIQFWPEMRGLEKSFLDKAAEFRQVVPVFTNVIYDTSQVHANQVFSSMFAWLDLVLQIILQHPETFFVIRAHPDEMRPGTAKQSRESVRDWVAEHGVGNVANVRFIDSEEYLSSYELIQRAKFVMVYNSSIGMEAAIMGAAVLCGGKARYTQYPMVFYPSSPAEFRQTAEQFLNADKIDVPAEYARNARRFLYYQLYRASLSFESYLEEGKRKGYVLLQQFSWQELSPQNSATIRLLEKAVLSEPDPGAFLIDDSDEQ